MNGAVPVGETESVLDCPEEIDDGNAVGAGADGGTHAGWFTVTIAVRLSAGDGHWPVTRTQYDVVALGETVN